MRKLVRFWAPDRFQFSDQSTQQIANFRSSFPINLPITFPITASACLQPPAVLRSAPALQASCLGWLGTPPSDLVPIRPPHVALHRLPFRGVSVPFGYVSVQVIGKHQPRCRPAPRPDRHQNAGRVNLGVEATRLSSRCRSAQCVGRHRDQALLRNEVAVSW